MSLYSIFIQHLLTHTSGLGEYDAEPIPEYQGKQIYDSDVVGILSKKKMLDSIPGEKYFYNNGGFCLLKLIVEKISKQDFRDFLQENIFGPLRMKTTLPNQEAVIVIPNRAYGYSEKDGEWLRTDQRQTSTTIGDGGIYSSIHDLALWSEIVQSGKILSPEMKALMLTKHVLTDEGPEIYYGFGVFLKEENGKLVAYHGGSTIGFEIGIYYALTERMTFVFLSNITGEHGSVKIAQLAEEYLSDSHSSV
ncbi:MAG: serine hydrolase [Patescibacteria group bacterium]